MSLESPLSQPSHLFMASSSLDLTLTTPPTPPTPPTPSTTITPSPPTLLTLPVELHLLITSNLTYPDALSLKHTNQYFYNLVYIGVNLKIEWLIERRRLHLDCPHNKKCELGSDMRHCRGSVRLLMKRRREHGECDSREGGRGCLVFGTKICTFRKKKVGIGRRARRWVGENWGLVVALVWVLIALVGVLGAWVWMGRV